MEEDPGSIFGGLADDLYFVGTMVLSGGNLLVFSMMFVKLTWQDTLRCDPTSVWQAAELLDDFTIWVKLRLKSIGC